MAIPQILDTANFLSDVRGKFNTNSGLLPETLEVYVDSTLQDIDKRFVYNHFKNTKAIVAQYYDNNGYLQTLDGIMQVVSTSQIIFNFNNTLVGIHFIYITFLKKQ